MRYSADAVNFNSELDESIIPFDPKSISISTKILSVETIVRRLNQGTLILNPDFQRAEVWTHQAKSQLIESLMLRIPIPMIYLSSDENNNFMVVDGLQRLSAIRDFLIPNLNTKVVDKEHIDPNTKLYILDGLEFFREYNGRTVEGLPFEYYNRIMETEITATIIEPNTPDEVKRNIFKRINTGGVILSKQEIRNAIYPGKVTALLAELTSIPLFKTILHTSYGKNRAEDQELVLRLISFMIRDVSEYQNDDMDSWLSYTMLRINFPDITKREMEFLHKTSTLKQTLLPLDSSTIRDKFMLSLNRGYALFNGYAFRKSVKGKKQKITKSLFEMWGISLSSLSQLEFEILIKNRHKLIEEYQILLQDKKFDLSITKNSNKASDIQFRFNSVKQLIYKYCK